MSDPARPSGEGDRLDAVLGRLRRTALRRTAVAVATWVGVVGAGTLLGAWLLAGADGWSPGTPFPLLLDLLLAATAGVAGFLLYRMSRRQLGERPLARTLERAAGLRSGTLLGALEVARRRPPGVSGGLARRAEDGVLDALPPRDRLLDATAAGPAHRWARRGAAVLLLGAGLLGALAASAPDRALDAWSGLLRPDRAMAGPALPPLSLEPESGELPRGTDLVVRVGAPGRDRITLRWQFAGDVARSREAGVREGRARVDLGELTAPVEIRAQSPDGASAGPVRITPLDPLLVTDLRVELSYPPHTGRQSETFRREVPPLEVPPGTRLRVDGRASRALASAGLRSGEEGTDGSGGTGFEVEGRGFRGDWRPVRSGTYRWRLRDLEGRPVGEAPPPVTLTVVPDSAPSIAILEPGRDTLLPLDRRQPLLIRARDDHGVSTIELRARRVTATGEAAEPVVQELRAGGTRGALARPLLDVREWELLPGDEIRYRAVAVDNSPRSQRTETREFSLRVPRRSEASREVQERIEEAGQAVDSLRRETGEAAGETRELQRRAAERRGGARETRSRPGATPEARESGSRTEEDASFERREDVRRAAQRQEELLERADSLRKALEALEEESEEAGLGEPELRKDLEELRELMESAADPEARESARELSERAGEMQAREMEEALEALAGNQEELRRELDRAMERFRRAAAEQDFRATAREARELAREEEALAEALRAGEEETDTTAAGEAGGDREPDEEADPGPRSSEAQTAMEERAGDLEERMTELDERLTRLGEQDARQGVEDARQRVGDARQSMSRSAEQRNRGRSGEAGRSGEEAARELRQAADALDRARNQMAQQMDQAVNDALGRAATEALSLARRQSEIRDGLRGARPSETAEMRGEQADVLQGLRNLAGNVGGVAAMAPGVGESVLDAVGGAAEALGETLEAMEDPRGGGTAPAEASERAIEALNRIALAASSGAGQQSGSQGSSSGAQQLRQQVQALARQQGNLTDRTGALNAMRPGSQALERRLREIAGGQESVAEELRELSRRQQALSRDEQLLGDLDALSEQAGEVAERLGRGRLDRETRQRQERLFHRLLDAGRSLEKDEESRERESTAAGEAERDPVEALTAGDRGGVRFGLPDAVILQSLSPAQRALVVRYFERLNRESGGPDGDGGGGGPP